MPALPDEQVAATPEWLALREACRLQGRKLTWVAAAVGMSYASFWAKMNRKPGYALRPAEQERIAAALGKSVAEIWADTEAEATE